MIPLESPLGIVSTRDLAFRLGYRRAFLDRVVQKVARYYSPFLDAKGAKPRLIDNPVDPLKSVQRRVQVRLLRSITLPSYLHGGISGRSALTNAAVHLGQRTVIRIDVRSFFPSITHEHIFQVWRIALGCSPTVARILTKLTTYRGRLPQGAPTSTTLANLVLLEADERFLHLSDQAGLSYTRFVDDFVFSGHDPRPLINQVVQILRAAGFRVAHKKLNIMPRGTPQVVTGYSVNGSKLPSVPRGRRDRVRAAIHQLQFIDPSTAAFPKHIRSIQGRIQHLQHTNPAAAKSLRCLLDEATT